ncbi:hypothetical protein AFK68_18575 [Hydrocoleum sp. CS-953]|nr:hypothetical protein AFK68_18575 [Hydrocoleum sp. CS-953]
MAMLLIVINFFNYIRVKFLNIVRAGSSANIEEKNIKNSSSKFDKFNFQGVIFEVRFDSD